MTQRLFPFLIGGFSKEVLNMVRMVPTPLIRNHISQNELKAFGDIYFDVVDAIAEKDLSYLE